MKHNLKIYGVLLIAVFSLLACNKELSLQRYFVDSKENDNYIALDIPSSILQLKEADASQEIKDIVKTVRKINFLGFQLTEETKVNYVAEKKKIKDVLKQKSYHELMRVNSGGTELMVKFLGEEEAIDEVVVYGAHPEKGFLVIRVLGDEMNPVKIIEMMQNVKFDDNNAGLGQLKGILSSIY